MGAQQSSRRITVVSDEASGVIKISDSVVNRLKEEIEGGSSSNHQKQEPPQVQMPANEPPPPQLTEPPALPVVPEATETVVPEIETPPPPPPEIITPPPEIIIPPPVQQEAPPPVEPVVIQDPRPQRPIIHYIEEPSLSSLKIRADKEKELNDLDNLWRKRMQGVEQEKTIISNLQAASIALSVKELEDLMKYSPVTPVCQGQRNLVTKCLQENQGHPLKCEDYVKEFSNCANSARLSFLERCG